MITFAKYYFINDKLQKITHRRLALGLQGKGRFAFSLEELCLEASPVPLEAIKHSLNRLVNKNKIVSVHQGYYIIVPPSYKNLVILPPIYFIDVLMNLLKPPYYISLINTDTYQKAVLTDSEVLFE